MVIDQELTAAAMQKADEIKQAFLDWVWTDDERRDMLTRLYNEKFNTNVPPTYDGSHLELVGASEAVKLRPHQKNAVWRAIQEGTCLLDHVVGAGKTLACVATVMESKRMGFLSKPMIVVPNQSHHCNFILPYIVPIFLQLLVLFHFVRPVKSGKTGLHPAYLLVYLRVAKILQYQHYYLI